MNPGLVRTKIPKTTSYRFLRRTPGFEGSSSNYRTSSSEVSSNEGSKGSRLRAYQRWRIFSRLPSLSVCCYARQPGSWSDQVDRFYPSPHDKGWLTAALCPFVNVARGCRNRLLRRIPGTGRETTTAGLTSSRCGYPRRPILARTTTPCNRSAGCRDFPAPCFGKRRSHDLHLHCSR